MRKLDSIQFKIVNRRLTLYAIEPIKERVFDAKFFVVPEEWKCKYRK